MNNPALDIVIGLVFIYTLYSLFATTINEIVATILAYRHRMLERGLEQMLDGKNYSYYWWDKVFNYVKWRFKYKSKGIERSTFLGKTPPPLQTETNETGNEANAEEIGKIANPEGKEEVNAKRAKLDKKSALFAAQVTNHPLYKRKAENSLLYKKPAYLESTAFSDILLDLFHTNKRLPLLLKEIEAAIVKSDLVNDELESILLLNIRQANGDVNRFKLLIENWYDDTMDRVTGWYKRQTQRVLFIIGFILAAAFNINTIEIVKILSEDEKVRTILADNAAKFVEKKLNEAEGLDKPGNAANPPIPKVPDLTQNSKDEEAGADTTKNREDSQKNPQKNETGKDTSLKSSIETADFEKTKKQIEKVKEFYRNEINDQNNLLGLGWPDDFGFIDDSISYNSKIQGTGVLAGVWRFFHQKPPTPPGLFGKGFFILTQIPKNLIGFLITALAISLGAPFWFDLLNKLVKLRATGQKPADSRDAGTATTTGNKTILMNQRPDPAAKG